VLRVAVGRPGQKRARTGSRLPTSHQVNPGPDRKTVQPCPITHTAHSTQHTHHNRTHHSIHPHTHHNTTHHTPHTHHNRTQYLTPPQRTPFWGEGQNDCLVFCLVFCLSCLLFVFCCQIWCCQIWSFVANHFLEVCFSMIG
jgi:hypothetical protein